MSTSEIRTILVTGGTGFIGRCLVGQLVQKYGAHRIICLVHKDAAPALEQTGRALLDQSGVRYIPIDLITGEGLEHVPRSPDIIFHLASNTDTGSNGHRVNDIGTKNLLKHIGPLSTNTRFIFTSTISATDNREHPHQPGNEESILKRPRSEYGRRKLETEHLLTQASREQNFHLAMLRVCAVYGTGTRSDGLYDALVRFAKKDSLLARLDYPGKMPVMHVDDIADLLIRMSDIPSEPGKPELFVAAIESIAIHEMSRAIYHALGKAYRPIHLPQWLWQITRISSPVIYALEPILPRFIYNKLWQLTLLVNDGYDNQSIRLKNVFPEKGYKSFWDNAASLIQR
jgi:nucleoside-diphosphate-sugar epimerase